MKPIKFKGHNVVFAEDQPEYQPLPAYKRADGNITTVWELTKEERLAIYSGANLRLSVSTFNQPLQPLLPYIEESDLGKADNALPSSVKMVKEFHDLFEHPVGRVLGKEPLNIRQLRIKLLFEELVELAAAGDVSQTMGILCFKQLQKFDCQVIIGEDKNLNLKLNLPPDGDNVDIVEEADALADLQYVLDGKKLTSGLYPYMEGVFERVHQNNMTKAHRSDAHAMETAEKGNMDGYSIAERGGLFFLYNSDGKLTKPWDHKKVSIAPLLPL